MTLVMTVVMSPMHMSSGMSGNVATMAFVTWHRRFRSVINRLRSAVFGISLVLSLFLQFGADLHGMQKFAYTRL